MSKNEVYLIATICLLIGACIGLIIAIVIGK